MTVKIDGSEFTADGQFSTDDTLEVTAIRSGGLNFKINEPWAGDSQTGFGKTCEIAVDRETACRLKAFIDEWIV